MRTYRLIRDSRGFSMIEIMVVVVLIGLLATLAAPNLFSFIPRVEARASVREVVSKMRQARSFAISRKEPYGFFLDNTSKAWVLFADKQNPGSNEYTGGDSVIVSGALDDRLSLMLNTFNNHLVMFNPDGSASQTGSICVSTYDQVLEYTIGVLGGTGRVRLQEGYQPYGG